MGNSKSRDTKINHDTKSQKPIPLPWPKDNHSSLHSGRTQDLSHDLRFNHTVNIINANVARVTNKEQYSNDQTRLVNHTIDQQKLPLEILTQNFITEWFSWKKVFLTYMQSIDPKGNNKDKWCMMLLNRMGPIGQKIYNTFTFEDSRESEDINKLLKKFDLYCIWIVFKNLTRKDADEIDKYVNALTVIASKHMTNMYSTDIDVKKNTDIIVKEKILMEIDKDKFKQKVENLRIPRFSYFSGVHSLTIKEMAYIWMSCENFDFKREEKILYSQVKNCRNCGDTHALNKCRAYGKKCNLCGIENHYSYRCPSQQRQYFDNCKWCGEGHFIRQCPAYGNECQKCQKLNHFSWKCKNF